MEAPRPLHDRICEVALASIGSVEHTQVGTLVRDARKMSFTREAAVAARDTLLARAWTVECNLDLVPGIGTPMWLEWPLPTVAGHGGGDLAVTGCLLAPHPADPETLVAVTGWFNGEDVGYSLAVSMVDTREIALMSYEARQDGDPGSHASLERILEHVHATLPPGFADEIETMTDATADLESVLRDATAEIPLALTLLLGTRAGGGLELTGTIAAGQVADLGTPYAPGLLARLRDLMSSSPRSGFVRRSVGPRSQVDWIRETASAPSHGE
jgi:hypothetical protein